MARLGGRLAFFQDRLGGVLAFFDGRLGGVRAFFEGYQKMNRKRIRDRERRLKRSTAAESQLQHKPRLENERGCP